MLALAVSVPLWFQQLSHHLLRTRAPDRSPPTSRSRVDLGFVYCLFRVHRRTWLGGPGPARGGPVGATQAAPDEPGRPA